MIANLLSWLGRSRLGQAAFTFLIERLFSFIKESIEREKKRREREELKNKLIANLENSLTPEDKQDAVDNINRYFNNK